MFRKTYDSLSLGVHLELLVDGEKACLKTWTEIDHYHYLIMQNFSTELRNGWKYQTDDNYSGLPAWADHGAKKFNEVNLKEMKEITENGGKALPSWYVDEHLVAPYEDGKPNEEFKDREGIIEVKRELVEISRSLKMPGIPAHMEFPPDVEGVYHNKLPMGRWHGVSTSGNDLLANVPADYKAKVEANLQDKWFMCTGYAWIDLTDPTIADAENSDAACWIIGIGANGSSTTPHAAFNALTQSETSKSHPLRTSRQYGRPVCLMMYKPFADNTPLEASLTLKYNQHYGFSTNIDGWTDGTVDNEVSDLFANPTYNYVGQLNEAFPNFVVTSGGGDIAADGLDTVTVEMRDGAEGAVIDRNTWVYLESTGGYLPKQRFQLQNGVGTFKVSAMHLEAGESFKVKIGFRNYSGMTDVEYSVV